ncbi:hypothetical protein BT96DRAFT_948072 [Gymnopus androsaceus JB14]|uniref:Uncharacterized protein n=1 Tax=Gymnopus androsaceus JB14 TaxID=1447944 RepID=A0A6A4GRP6_9AGAR|nr:hypothetical protein BT96DRAFT_948072 [Gymnopus androsaceus JB14]
MVLVVAERDFSVAGISPQSARYRFFPVAQSSGIKITHAPTPALDRILIMATPIHALLQHNDGATEIEVSTKVLVIVLTMQLLYLDLTLTPNYITPFVNVQASENWRIFLHDLCWGPRRRDEVHPYVEGIAGVHYEPFTTYEAALQAYTDTYNCEEYSPQLKIVEHPNLDQGIKIHEARRVRRMLNNN